VASDGHRLAVCETAIDQPSALADTPPRVCIVPRHPVLNLLKQLPDNETPVSITVHGSSLAVRYPGVEVSTKLIEGRYPDWRRVMPDSHEGSIIVDREATLSALKRVAVLSNEVFKGIRWTVRDNFIEIDGTNPDNESAHEELSLAHADGFVIELGFNAKYLIDALSVIDHQNAELALSKRGVIVSDPCTTNYRSVVMPMRL